MYCGELQVLLSSVARSSESYSRSKGSAVLVNEFLQCHRRVAADFLNQLIRPGEDAVSDDRWRLHADAAWRRNLLAVRSLFRTRHREPARDAQEAVVDTQR